jgi:hypothetical protein
VRKALYRHDGQAGKHFGQDSRVEEKRLANLPISTSKNYIESLALGRKWESRDEKVLSEPISSFLGFYL